ISPCALSDPARGSDSTWPKGSAGRRGRNRPGQKARHSSSARLKPLRAVMASARVFEANVSSCQGQTKLMLKSTNAARATQDHVQCRLHLQPYGAVSYLDKAAWVAISDSFFSSSA